MSSARYVAELRPDPTLRHILTGSSLVGLLLGLWVVFSLPIDGRLRLLAATGWAIALATGYCRRQVAQRQLHRLRLHADGSAMLQGPDGRWSSAELGRDSVVTAQLAWLRLRRADSRKHVELMRGNARENENWRRLQVIWRHLPRRPSSRLGSSS